MRTIYDYVSMASFAALIVLFLHRSTAPDNSRDPIWRYLVAMTGFAVGDVAGNRGYPLVAWAVFALTAAFVLRVLLPIRDRPRS